MASGLNMRAPLLFAKSGISTVYATLLTLLSVAAPQSAIAQGRDFSSYFLDVVPSKFVAAALAQPYGQAVVTQFAAALGDSADPACLQAEKMTKEQLSARARALLQERGALMLQRLISMTDRAAFKNYLHARIGREGVAEFERLRTDPAVRAYVAADEPAEHVFIVQYIVENIQRYATISRISFARPFSPLGSDIPSLGSVDPTDKIDAALKKLIADDTSGALARYLEMTAMAQKPYRDAANMELARKFGPGELLARKGRDNKDLTNELVELCVVRSQPKQ
jgi:hypothetical protein